MASSIKTEFEAWSFVNTSLSTPLRTNLIHEFHRLLRNFLATSPPTADVALNRFSVDRNMDTFAERASQFKFVAPIGEVQAFNRLLAEAYVNITKPPAPAN